MMPLNRAWIASLIRPSNAREKERRIETRRPEQLVKVWTVCRSKTPTIPLFLGAARLSTFLAHLNCGETQVWIPGLRDQTSGDGNNHDPRR